MNPNSWYKFENKHNFSERETMHIRLILISTALCCSTSFGMQKSIPPAKEGAAALLNYVMKKCGLTEINTEETQKVLTAFAECTNDKANTVHELMQLANFQTLANRTAEKDYLIDLELLEAMRNNNTAKIRALLERCKDRQSIKDVAKKFLEEENTANSEIVDPHAK